MRTETGTFELRDNDMMMRELTYAETNEVAGGVAFVQLETTNANAAGTIAAIDIGTTATAQVNLSVAGGAGGGFLFVRTFADKP
jgi:hypothetical protein